MRPIHHLLAALASTLCLAVTTPAAEAGSAGRSSARPKATAAAKRVRQAAVPKVTYANGDTEAQRRRREDARLRRECKGRPNAGACLGYTR